MTYFRDIVETTVKHAIAYAVYPKSLVQVSPQLVELDFETK